jgi:hypothetical protein
MTYNTCLSAVENYVITDYMAAYIIFAPIVVGCAENNLTLSLCSLLELEMCIFVVPCGGILTQAYSAAA